MMTNNKIFIFSINDLKAKKIIKEPRIIKMPFLKIKFSIF